MPVSYPNHDRALTRRGVCMGLLAGAAILSPHYAQSDATWELLRSAALSPGSRAHIWLENAFLHLTRIWEKRKDGRRRDNAFCIFEAGDAYVQFLAPWDAELMVCEAVSAKCAPEVAIMLNTGGDAVLRKLGFEGPDVSPNYSQTIKIAEGDDLAYAALLAFRVLQQVYRVFDFSPATFKLKLPGSSSNVTAEPITDLPLEEREVFEIVAKSHGREWAERHLDLILEQARSVGQL